MKIYTEVNYKWLDGQLEETDSKSFDYKGELTLCVGGSLGTALGSVGLGAVTTNSGEGSKLTDVIAEGMSSGSTVIGDNMQDATSAMNTNLDTGTEGIGMNEGVSTTLTDTGDMINEGITTGIDAAINDNLESGINTSIDDAGDAIRYNTEIAANAWDVVVDRTLGFAGDVQEFMHPGFGDGDTVADPKNIKSNAKDLKNKAKANLKVNKSKGRARKSLRIG